MKKYAVIVAGGAGTRMKTDLPKQFLMLGKLPVLMHTVEKFHNYDTSLEIIIVLPEYQIDFWEQLCNQHKFSIKHHVIRGGKTRSHSVQNGLQLVEDDSLVAVHDGVRPLVTKEVIAESYTFAKNKGSAIAAIPLKDSIRKFEGGTTISKNRNDYVLIQTPQTFSSSLLKQAYDQTEPSENFTDDASVFEALHGKVTLIIGDYKNIKITTPEDLIIAQALLVK
ncbi:MAG: 2-C-methyl-D-erythritol 4-phosphate cytidylyltransferase [Cyclobacteriaceae bacterium]|nr:2-C-methyl-D-erythritol 4-phosphate cytidylyltransferase [Cyclobacteriaceae bacterium]